MDLRIRMGSSMVVVGPSNSGKTVFVIKFMDAARDIFDIPPQKVFWCYGHRTAAHDLLVKKNYNMIHGVPENFDFLTPYSLVVLDDLQLDTLKSTAVTQLFIRGAHHTPCFVITTQHNLFVQGPQARNRHLNTQYYVLLRNPGDQGQFEYMARQMFPSTKVFVQASYRDAVRKPHGYLLIDSHQKTPEVIRIRTNILPSEKPLVTYVDKQHYSELVTSKKLPQELYIKTNAPFGEA
jgi:hypothetical protein